MICHENKLIFIHIPNTGGSSIEVALIGQDWFTIEKRTKHLGWIRAKRRYSKYWDNYFKFAVVRNPWEWLVSIYNTHDRKRKLGDPSWDFFLRRPKLMPIEQKILIQSDIIGDEMDFIIRFENLKEDFDKMCEKAGVGKKILPHRNKSKTTKIHYSLYYENDEQVELVREKFKKDIERFGYEFDDRRKKEDTTQLKTT
ncbi:MAG: hypothetical protein A2511_17500 [Deltaproteobacteria bacterium RIFOXYD12_FULL_50_9]|nr:MAG: hypothetical protein A2511_17500 [Deltaproteobacteria bacterium RIFOXYD12_FULL_50_9]